MSRRPTHPEQFMKSLLDFMQLRGTPITRLPLCNGHQVNLVNLYAAVMRLGGSQKVGKQQLWDAVAQSVGFAAEVFPGAPMEISSHYQQYLAPYEEAWFASQSHQSASTANIAKEAVPYGHPSSGRHGSESPNHTSLPKNVNEAGTTSSKSVTANASRASDHPKEMLQLETIVGTPLSNHHGSSRRSSNNSLSTSAHRPNSVKESSTPKTLIPKKRVVTTDGGVDTRLASVRGAERSSLRPSLLSSNEFGVVDLHNLLMSLRSGLICEARQALDTLAIITADSGLMLSLSDADDLMECLCERAIIEMDALGADTTSSPSLVLPAYGALVLECHEVRQSLSSSKHCAEAQSRDSSINRLLCVTTILRNLSFVETNTAVLCRERAVPSLVVDLIFSISNSSKVFGSVQNLLDLYKDILILLSNISHEVQVKSETEALGLLSFLVAFAPDAKILEDEQLLFPTYSPAKHCYLPAALDVLAKLLARDHPNRAFFYKILFPAVDVSKTHSYKLLIEMFAIAIAPLPRGDTGFSFRIVELRLPLLEEGMLVADILGGMAPSSFPFFQKLITSKDAFVARILRLACSLSAVTAKSSRLAGHCSDIGDTNPFIRVSRRGMTFLKTLFAKADGKEELANQSRTKTETLLGALLTANMNADIVRDLCDFEQYSSAEKAP